MFADVEHKTLILEIRKVFREKTRDERKQHQRILDQTKDQSLYGKYPAH